ncbi:MAG: hypothetical protein HY597_05190 [Candidatus Omnitrophica bacterium]|nr:hypothetical protein [Candidatus Omnitrophota bacterium]
MRRRERRTSRLRRAWWRVLFETVAAVLVLWLGLRALLTGRWHELAPRRLRRSRQRLHQTQRTFLDWIVTERPYHAIRLYGPRRATQTIAHALEFLRQHDPEAWQLIQQHLSFIVVTRRRIRGAWVFPGRLAGLCFVGQPFVKEMAHSYLAAALAHEAYHRKLRLDYHRGWRRYVAPVPPEVYSGERGEKKCLTYQCRVLERLGIPPRVVKRYQRQMLTSRWWEG